MDDEDNETTDLGCEDVKAETDKALLCVIDGEEHWVPKSQIHDDSPVYKKGQSGTLIVTAWWANKRGLG